MLRKMNELNNAKVVMCNVFRKSPIKTTQKNYRFIRKFN